MLANRKVLLTKLDLLFQEFLEDQCDAQTRSAIVGQALNELENIYVLPIVNAHYGSHTSKNFLDGINLETLRNISPRLWRIASNLLSNLIRGYRIAQGEFQDSSIITFIGDFHPYRSMRYKHAGDVLFHSLPYYDIFLRKLINTYFPSVADSFPKHFHNKAFIKRQFIPVKLDTDHEEDIIEYYTQLGKLIGITILVRGIDINAENLIAHLPNPVFFDLECIFVGRIESEDEYTLDSTGIVQVDAQYDVSAYTGGTKPVQSYLKPFLTGTKQKPRVQWRVPSKGKYYNIPTFRGIPVSPTNYREYVIKGLREVREVIFSHYGEIGKLVESTEVGTRTIISPTRLYRVILQSFAFPQVHTQLTPQQHFTNELSQRSPIVSISTNAFLREYEIDCLNSWLVPKYYSEIHSPDIYASDGKIVGQYRKTQYKQWVEHYRDLTVVFDKAEQRFSEIYP